jgi:hypothetical protein
VVGRPGHPECIGAANLRVHRLLQDYLSQSHVKSQGGRKHEAVLQTVQGVGRNVINANFGFVSKEHISKEDKSKEPIKVFSNLAWSGFSTAHLTSREIAKG